MQHLPAAVQRWKRGHTHLRAVTHELLLNLAADEPLPRNAFERFRRSLACHSNGEERSIFNQYLDSEDRERLARAHTDMELPDDCLGEAARDRIRRTLEALLPHMSEEEALVDAALASAELTIEPVVAPSLPMLADVLTAASDFNDIIPGASLRTLALSVMTEPEPDAKVGRVLAIVRSFFEGELDLGPEFELRDGEDSFPSKTLAVPSAPARPAWLIEVAPKDSKTKGSRIRSILHGVAHAESYAIDLSIDIVVRFGWEPTLWQCDLLPNSGGIAIEPRRRLRLPDSFFHDWLRVAAEEALHFSRWRDRLVELGSSYGSETGHAMLWQSVSETAGSLPARLAIVHCVHEGRGLDTALILRTRLEAAKDVRSLEILAANHADEITHVAAGVRWLRWLVARQQQSAVSAASLPDTASVASWTGSDSDSDSASVLNSTSGSISISASGDHDGNVSRSSGDKGEDAVISTFHALVKANFRGKLKGPFNVASRQRAGMVPRWWLLLSDEAAVASSTVA